MRAFGQRCPGPKKIYGLVGKTVGHPPCGNFSPCKKLFPHPPAKKQHGPKNGLIGRVRDNPELLIRVRAQQPRLVTQPVTWGKPCSPAVPSECLVALLAHPAGWLAPGIPARAGGPLRGVQSGPSWPAEALVRSRWPPVYPGVCRRSWRCPASAWRRSRPLLRGGSPLGYPLVLEGLYVGRSLAPAGLLRPWYVAGGPRSIPGYAAAPGGARRVPGGAPGPSCGVAAPGIPARVGGTDVGHSLAPSGLLRPCYVARGPRSIPGYDATLNGAR